MALVTSLVALSSGVANNVAISTSARRSLYMQPIGLGCYIGASSTVTSTSGFLLSTLATIPFRLDGAQASDSIWAISTAAGASLNIYTRT